MSAAPVFVVGRAMLAPVDHAGPADRLRECIGHLVIGGKGNHDATLCAMAGAWPGQLRLWMMTAIVVHGLSGQDSCAHPQIHLADHVFL
jgi:hypothetical protein